MARRSRSRSHERREKKSSRRRSRSRSPRKHRSRDRSRSRGRDGRSGRDRPDDLTAQAQAVAMAQLQQQQLQKQLLAQQLLLQQQAMSGNTAMMTNKKQREVYIGNLTIGVVNDVMLRELFNAALAHLVPDPHINPPVVSTSMDPSGRFGFVELRTEELSCSAMQLDKVELCGRAINVGRPKGYIEPPPGARPVAALGAAQAFAAGLGSAPTTVLRLDNMVKAVTLLDEQERVDLLEDVQEESKKYGAMQGVLVPRPPATVGPLEPARVFIWYTKPTESEAARKVFDGRTFDGNKISASFVSEQDYRQAEAGVWPQAAGALPPPPAMGAMGALPGLPGLPPMYAGMQAPMMNMMMMGGGMPAGAGEGWIKLRGVPFTASKQDFIMFFQGCANVREDQVKLVMGIDGRPTGEAFVEISGPGCNLALALGKDRQVMPNSSRYVEIFSSNREEMERRPLTGGMLV